MGTRADSLDQRLLPLSTRPSAPPTVLIPLSPAKPTIVYDTYWRFAAERQRVFFSRQQGHSWPWTDDPILRDHKFTNAYRAADRVSQYLIRNVIYAGSQDPAEVFFRVLLFKVFNRIDTWELIAATVGRPTFADYSYRTYNRILTDAMAKGAPIYSAAYIMPSGGKLNCTGRKHRMHLRLIEKMLADELPKRLQDARTMAEAFAMLRAYPTIGDFLAYQYVTDLNYSTLLNFDEMQFVVPGPGALNGIRKCFRDLGGLSEIEMIKFVTQRQSEEFNRLNLEFKDLWGRSLQLIDCQNLFCEVDKYARVKHPEFSGASGRTRIKQRFRPIESKIDYWFPPKWGLNARIKGRPA